MSRRWITATSFAFAAALALTGCASTAAEPTPWQGAVQTLASQASGGDYASASTTLDQLEADVLAQRDAGTVSAAEAEAILARIAVVRADLSGLVLDPEPTAEQSSEPVTQDTAEPTQSTVDDQPETVEDPPTQTEPADEGPGNSDKGEDGKGNSGKGKGDGSQTPVGPGKEDG